MLPYFVLGIALLVGFLLAARWFAAADPQSLVKVLKRVAFGLILGVIVFMGVTGRLAWALAVLPALLPWVLRFRSLARAAKNFSRMSAGMAAGAGTGQTSEVETRFLRMVLDHDSGTMTGEVIAGPHAGRRLETMPVDDLIELLRGCRTEDPPSVQVLEAYLDRAYGNWRQREQATGRGAAGAAGFGGGAMTRDEAFQILGLAPGAGAEEVKEAYHRLMAALHPDRGGSTYLAAKLNQAKDLLLGD